MKLNIYYCIHSIFYIAILHLSLTNYLIKLFFFVGTLSINNEDMDIQNVLDDYDDEDGSELARLEEN